MLLLSTEIFIITFFFTLVISIFVLFNDHKNNTNRLFSLLCFSIGLWILSNIFVNVVYNNNLSLLFARIAIIWVALIPIFFNKFIEYLYFFEDLRYKKINGILLYISSVITLVIVLLSQTDYNVGNISFESWGVSYGPGILYILLLFYMLGVFGFSFFHLFIISREPKNQKRHQARSILLGACITVTLSIFTNIVFPFMGYGIASIFGPPTVLIFLLFIAYSITRHRLFNIRVITIELVTFGLWAIILIRTLLAETRQEMFIEGGLLIVTVIFGIMLIRSALQEIKQRERIEKLADDLQKTYASVKELNENLELKVAEQTKDVRRAYDVEKKARYELEKLNETKDELITAAQHNLRTPLTTLRWQIETIRKSTNGKDGDSDVDNHSERNNLQKALQESENSVKQLTEVLEDFLNITALKVKE